MLRLCKMVHFFILLLLVSTIRLSPVFAHAGHNRLLGIWSEPALEDGKCGAETLEISETGKEYFVDARSDDLVCSWKGVRQIAQDNTEIGRFDAYKVIEQCHHAKSPNNKTFSSAGIVHAITTADSHEDLYIGSLIGDYSGLYRRCIQDPPSDAQLLTPFVGIWSDSKKGCKLYKNGTLDKRDIHYARCFGILEISSRGLDWLYSTGSTNWCSFVPGSARIRGNGVIVPVVCGSDTRVSPNPGNYLVTFMRVVSRLRIRYQHVDYPSSATDYTKVKCTP